MKARTNLVGASGLSTTPAWTMSSFHSPSHYLAAVEGSHRVSVVFSCRDEYVCVTEYIGERTSFCHLYA